MGQKFTRQSDEWDSEWIRRFNHRAEPPKSFPDLNLLPAELGLKILSNVDAQDLRLVQSIWSHLANDDHLWKRLVVYNASNQGTITLYRDCSVVGPRRAPVENMSCSIQSLFETKASLTLRWSDYTDLPVVLHAMS